MSRPYNNLRHRMKAQGVSIYDIAKAFRCTGATVSNKLRGVSPWTLGECWTVMDVLKICPQDMARYFPRNGSNE